MVLPHMHIYLSQYIDNDFEQTVLDKLKWDNCLQSTCLVYILNKSIWFLKKDVYFLFLPGLVLEGCTFLTSEGEKNCILMHIYGL